MWSQGEVLGRPCYPLVPFYSAIQSVAVRKATHPHTEGLVQINTSSIHGLHGVEISTPYRPEIVSSFTPW